MDCLSKQLAAWLSILPNGCLYNLAQTELYTHTLFYAEAHIFYQILKSFYKLRQYCYSLFSQEQLQLSSTLCLSCSLFPSLRDDFVQLSALNSLPQAVVPNLYLHSAYSLSLLPLLLLFSYSTVSSAAVSALITMLYRKDASRELVFLSRFLPPPSPLLHGNPQLQTGLSVFIGWLQIGLLGSVSQPHFCMSPGAQAHPINFDS